MVQRDEEYTGLKATLVPVKVIVKPPLALVKQFSHHHHQFILPRRVQIAGGNNSQSWAYHADVLFRIPAGVAVEKSVLPDLTLQLRLCEYSRELT